MRALARESRESRLRAIKPFERRGSAGADAVTLTQDASAFAKVTDTLAVPSRTGSKLQPHNALGNRARASMSR